VSILKAVFIGVLPHLFLPRCGRIKEGESALVYIKLDDAFLALHPPQRGYAASKEEKDDSPERHRVRRVRNIFDKNSLLGVLGASAVNHGTLGLLLLPAISNVPPFENLRRWRMK
jgi:hypothetical protein